MDHLGSQRAPKECQWEPFWTTFGQQAEMSKLCSRFHESIVFEVGGGPEGPQLQDFGHIFVCMRFRRYFLQKVADLGSHWGAFGDPLGALLGDF